MTDNRMTNEVIARLLATPGLPAGFKAGLAIARADIEKSRLAEANIAIIDMVHALAIARAALVEAEKIARANRASALARITFAIKIIDRGTP